MIGTLPVARLGYCLEGYCLFEFAYGLVAISSTSSALGLRTSGEFSTKEASLEQFSPI